MPSRCSGGALVLTNAAINSTGSNSAAPSDDCWRQPEARDHRQPARPALTPPLSVEYGYFHGDWNYTISPT